MIRRRVPWIALWNNHGSTAQRNMTPTTDQLRYHTCTHLEHTHCRQPPSGVAWHAARLSFSHHTLVTLPTGPVAIPGTVTIWRAGRRGQSPSAPHLPLFDRLGAFAIDGHGNSSWTAQQRHGERTNTFSGFNEAAGPRGPAIGCANDSTPLALGPSQTKAMWPVVHSVHFWCVRASARNALQLADSQPEADRRRRVEIPIINALSAAPHA